MLLFCDCGFAVLSIVEINGGRHVVLVIFGHRNFGVRPRFAWVLLVALCGGLVLVLLVEFSIGWGLGLLFA